MNQKTTKLMCATCGHPVYWKLLEPVHQKAVIELKNPRLLYYRYKCPKCKVVTEFYPNVVRDVWVEENPGVKIAIKF